MRRIEQRGIIASARRTCRPSHTPRGHISPRGSRRSSLGACSVEWSTGRMTLVAGTCQFQRASRGNDEAHGGCRIRLSEPLLKYRPAKDVQETLLHEMIHAFIFLHRIRDDGDHGTEFQRIMIRINESPHPADPFRPPGGYHVTVYHSMHEEVEHYRQHWWDCQRWVWEVGKCARIPRRASSGALIETNSAWPRYPRPGAAIRSGGP